MATTGRDSGSSAIAASFAAEVNVFNARMLRRYRGAFIYRQFASPEVNTMLPGNAGTDLVRWNRIKSLSVGTSTNTTTATAPYHVTTPISEGVNPTSVAISKESVTAKLQQYGKIVEYTDVVAAESIFNIPMEVRTVLEENYMETMDSVVQSALTKRAGLTGETNNTATQLYYADGTAVNGVSAALTKTVIDNALKKLRTEKAPLVTQPNLTSDRVDTKNIMASYIIIASPAQADIIAGFTGWTPIEQYGSAQFATQVTNGNLYYTERGAYTTGAITARVFSTQNQYFLDNAGKSNADVGITPIFGAGYFGVADSANQRMQVLVATQPDSGDELALIDSIGWKAKSAASIVNQKNGALGYSATV